MKRKKILSLFLVFSIMASIFIMPNKVNAMTQAWEHRPITVYADQKLSDMEISQLKEAINAWNSTRFGTFFTYGGKKPSFVTSSYPNAIGVTKMPFYNSPETIDDIAQTTTTISNSTGRPTKATIAFNTNCTYTNNSTVSGEFYLKSVLMHELFHALGFSNDEHSLNPNSFFNAKYTGKTGFLESDLSLIDELY